MSFELVNPSRIEIGGVDVTSSVTMIRVDRDPPMPDSGLLFVREMFAPVRFTGRTISLTPLGYRMLLGRTHPRLKRMHAAYGRRRR